MPKPAHFKVHPRLAALLGDNYRSSEDALKELVDNAWDADSDNVTITLPDLVNSDPIVIEDDGTGMTEREVREEYLHVASGRHSRKGAFTSSKKRPVKGRKGIGKFAGLLAAGSMFVETRAKGFVTRLRITKADLLNAGRRDLERIDLPLEVEACGAKDHGTRITLSGLAQNLLHPSAEKLKRLIVLEYDRKESFVVLVNGEPAAIEDISGDSLRTAADLDVGGHVNLTFTVSEKSLKQPGIAIRIGGKIVGKPSMLGLEDDETIPAKLLKRVYGEVDADALAPDVTPDWGAIFENSAGFASVKAWVGDQVKQKIVSTFKNEVSLQKARLQKDVNQRLAALPENRRSTADAAIQRVLEKLYAEGQERVQVVVSLMLDAFEKDEYWAVFKSLDETARADVVRLADTLGHFGMVDLAVVGQQARGRLDFLAEFDGLIANAKTLESQVHTAIERNLWVLGWDSRVLSSNETLAQMIQRWAEKKYKGARAAKRPDLFLARSSPADYLLIEFKRPSHTISRADEGQAATYRDEIAPHVGGQAIDVLVIGGKRDGAAASSYDAPRLRVATYVDLVSKARSDLTWLLGDLTAGR